MQIPEMGSQGKKKTSKPQAKVNCTAQYHMTNAFQ